MKKQIIALSMIIISSISMTAASGEENWEAAIAASGNVIVARDLKEGEAVDVGHGAAFKVISAEEAEAIQREYEEIEAREATTFAPESNDRSNAAPQTTVYTEPTAIPRSAYEHEVYNDYYMLYTVDFDGSAILLGVDSKLSTSTSEKLIIPEKLGGHTVKEIKSILYFSGAPSAVSNNLWKTVTEIELPKTIKIIEDEAFAGMTHLKKLNLPDGLTYLGDYVCNLVCEEDEVILPDSVKVIGKCAFQMMPVKKVVLPDGLEKIGELAFMRSGITELELPESVTTIEKKAFDQCSDLLKIYIPDSLKNYSGLSKAFIEPRTREVIYNGDITEEIRTTFLYTPYMRNYVAEHEENKMIIEDGVLVLYGDTSKNAVIPEGVTEIGRYALNGVDIQTVKLPSTLTKIDMNSFSYSNLQDIYIPASVTTIEQVAFYHCDDLQRVEFEDKGQRVSIGDSAFEFCPLEYVILPKNYNIGAFGGTDNFWDAVEKGKTMPRRDSKPAEATSTAAPEDAPEKSGTFVVSNKNGSIGISLNGETIPFRTDKPFIDENGRTQAPLRAVMEHFGCNVSYDEKTRTVEASKLGRVVMLTIGSPDMTVNGETVKMDTAARIVNDRTYIPIRFVAETLGFDVAWR